MLSKPRRFDRAVDGILLLDKPQGMSSNAALQQARMVFRALKAGHAGSLDPLATGMLPICFGEATKVCNWLLDAPKRYRFVAQLGSRTDTADAEGKVIETCPVPELSQSAIQACLQSMLGEQLQVPPMYSALKHAGERLYAMARRGESVPREPRKICITQLELIRFNGHALEAIVECSKGTYVRTLAEDIAARLGTIAHLTALRRLTVLPFAEGQMQTLEKINAGFAGGGFEALETLLMPADVALGHMHAVNCELPAQLALRQGKTIDCCSDLAVGTLVRIYGPNDCLRPVFLGIGEVVAPSRIHPRRLWNLPNQPESAG